MTTQRCDFGGLSVEFDDRVLTPRPWTTAQSEWAAELGKSAGPGPILELCAGAGHIGLLAARLSGRALVQVEADAVAAGFANRNAAAAGLADHVEVRSAPMTAALASDELFPLIIADPPYLPTDQIGRFPADPRTAIDGGREGLDVVRECLDVIAKHLAPGGVALLQVAGPVQADAVSMVAGGVGLQCDERRVVDAERAVVLLRRLGPVSGGAGA